MAATGGVTFLQSNVEDGPKTLGNYKAGNTDVIRKMLREQQRECQALHANPLFKEFRGNGASVRQKKFGKGYVVAQEELNVPPLLDPKSLDYEGKYRLFELIKDTAVKEEKTQQGVWAAFNSPYMPLGEPRELQKTLPHLNRDDIGSREGQRGSQPRRKGLKQSAPQPPPQQQQPQGAPSGPSSPQRGRAGSEDDGIGNPYAEQHEDNMSQAAASIRAATQEAEDVLNKHKSVMRFNINDRAEARFPAAVLRQTDNRILKAKSASGAFVNRREADEEMRDPHRAYGQPPLPRKNLAPIPGPLRGQQGDDEQGPSFFLTQPQQQPSSGGAGMAGNPGAFSSSTFHASASNNGMLTADPDLLTSGSRRYANNMGPTELTEGGSLSPGYGRSNSPAGGASTSGMQADGTFVPLVDQTVPRKGDEANPVYKWHNDFVAVRQSGRTALQQQLFARAQGRANARSDSTAAAGLSTTLLGQLNLMHGRMPGYAGGTKSASASPYTRLEQYQQAQEAARRNAKQKAVQALDPAEIRILQRFYDQLCALVEAQRMSDPLCLMVVSKVKALLEAGTYLHRPMLVAVVEHVSEFTRGAGMLRFNKYLLAMLTFVTKCVGLDVSDLEELVEQNGVSIVVYGTPVPPSRVTPEIVAGLQAEEGGAPGSGAAQDGEGSAAGTSAQHHPQQAPGARAPSRGARLTGAASKGRNLGATVSVKGAAAADNLQHQGSQTASLSESKKRYTDIAALASGSDIMTAADKMNALAGALLTTNLH